jgi:hypothetical protein
MTSSPTLRRPGAAHGRAESIRRRDRTAAGQPPERDLDKEVRGELGIRPGDQAVEWVEDGRLVVEFMPRSDDRSLLGIFKRPDLPPITSWQALKDEAWTARTAEIMDVLEADGRRHREPAGE